MNATETICQKHNRTLTCKFCFGLIFSLIVCVVMNVSIFRTSVIQCSLFLPVSDRKCCVALGYFVEYRFDHSNTILNQFSFKANLPRLSVHTCRLRIIKHRVFSEFRSLSLWRCFRHWPLKVRQHDKIRCLLQLWGSSRLKHFWFCIPLEIWE